MAAASGSGNIQQVGPTWGNGEHHSGSAFRADAFAGGVCLREGPALRGHPGMKKAPEAWGPDGGGLAALLALGANGNIGSRERASRS